MQCHFGSAVVGHGFAHGFRDAAQAVDECIGNRLGAGIVELGQEGHATCAFDKSADGRCIARALDKIAFGVARLLAIIDLCGALIDGDHV